MNTDLRYSMFDEERLTEKMNFSQKPRAAFPLFAGVRKSLARFFACRSLFAETSASVSCVSALHTSDSHSFASHVFRAPTGILRKFALVGFCLSFVSCANIFQDKVAMSRSGTSATLGDIFVGGAVVGKLDTPSEIHVSCYEFKDSIRISWSPVKNVAYYVLERAVVTEKTNGEWVAPDESEFEPLEHSSYTDRTSFTDTVISGDTNDLLNCENEKYGYAFFYRVRAENPRLGYEESEFVYSGYAMLLQPPSGTKASAGESENYIKVTWNRISGASRYKIYRSENEDGTNSTLVATVTSNMTEYKDETVSSYKGQDLFYTVRAVSPETGKESVDSPVGLGYTLVPGAPPAVGEVRVKAGEGRGDKPNSITIEWDPVSGDGIFYTVYRSSSENSTMKKLGVGTGSFTDSKDLKQNVYYYYYVQTSKEETKDDVVTILKGPMSKSGPESDNPAEGFVLSAPSSVEVQKIRGETDYLISFTPVVGDRNFASKPQQKSENEYMYVVYGNETQIGSFAEVKSAFSSVLVFDDVNGKYSMKVSPHGFYKVQVEYNGEKSVETAVVAPAPYEARDVYVTRAELVGDYGEYTPSGEYDKIEKANSNGVHPVKITWKVPDGGAYAYNIYRSEKVASGFRKITENPIHDTGASEYEYIDKNDVAKAGSIYYYYVVSLNSLGQGVNKSEIDEPTLESNIIKTKNADGTPCGRGWGWGALSAWQYMQEQRKTIESSQKKLTLMHKPNNLDKVGSETIHGDISGTLGYTAKVEGLGARITMPYSNYADSYIGKNPSLGIYFLFNGDTNTKSDMSANGSMDGTVVCRGMYPGKVSYDNVKVKGGAAGGGTYRVTRDGIDSDYVEVNWKAGDKN